MAMTYQERIAMETKVRAMLTSGMTTAQMADELGITNGSRVRVSSKRGHIEAVAMVTKRIKALQIDGKTVHQVGVPIHWGFLGAAKPGYIANTLTNAIGDGNSQTPESKCILVKVEKM